MTMKSASAESAESLAGDLALRRRRALYRATHRGTQEMDYLLGRFAVSAIATLGEADIAALERLVELPDPEIEACVTLGFGVGDAGVDELIDRVRRFHGLPGAEET
jgi:antitoxin CptB